MKLNEINSLLVASLAFGLHHVIVINLFAPLVVAILGGVLIALGGFIWGKLYLRTDNIAGAWLSHAMVDGMLAYIGYTLIF